MIETVNFILVLFYGIIFQENTVKTLSKLDNESEVIRFTKQIN